MAFSGIWAARLQMVINRIVEIVWVVIIYLSSELIIWGLSRVMAPVHIEFFASILGMAMIFVAMTTLYLLRREFADLYRRFAKSKVDFINVHMGVGFTIPIIMMNPDEILPGADIGRVIANFLVTNLASWLFVFFLAFTALVAIPRMREVFISETSYSGVAQPLNHEQLNQRASLPTQTTERQEKLFKEKSSGTEISMSSSVSQRSSSDGEAVVVEVIRTSAWTKLLPLYPIFLSLFCLLAIGAPVLAATGDSGVLDGSTLWFVWITAVRMVRLFKQSDICVDNPRLKNAVATFMNPVLWTTLIMTAYTRAKSSAIPGSDLAHVLNNFSSGTPLNAIWTSSVAQTHLPNNPSRYFGAGDVALSLLETGILIWGFKLFECRRQLFCMAGCLTITISLVAAIANVFVCVALARAMGLDDAEALSFSARSTTLALAKPAIQAVGGNMVVNAALVVSNGILGQLIYPFVLRPLGVKREPEEKPLDSSHSNDGCDSHLIDPSNERQHEGRYEERHSTTSEDEDDDATTIAAGISIGINGAAMGVAYLYETKSRAAPYAALSMTVFGVMTVVFTTVEPFKTHLVAMANV